MFVTELGIVSVSIMLPAFIKKRGGIFVTWSPMITLDILWQSLNEDSIYLPPWYPLIKPA